MTSEGLQKISSLGSDNTLSDIQESLHNLKLNLSNGREDLSRTIFHKSTQGSTFPKLPNKVTREDNSPFQLTKGHTISDELQSLIDKSTKLLSSDCSQEELRIRNFFKHQDYDQGFQHLKQCVQSKFASISEALCLRQELSQSQQKCRDLTKDNDQLKSDLKLYRGKYQKTKVQKQDLLKFYRQEKSYQHTQKLIAESKEYLAILNKQIDREKIRRVTSENVHEETYVADEAELKHREQQAIINNLLQEIELLKVQCSMQQKLIQARSQFMTHVHVQVQPLTRKDEQDQFETFQILDEPELGLAKQISIGDSICFVDSARRTCDLKKFPVELEHAVLQTKHDVLIGVIAEPRLADLQLTVAHRVSEELDRIQRSVTDVKVYYKFGQISQDLDKKEYERLNGSIAQELYDNFDFTASYQVQFRHVKKLHTDQFDTSQVTLLLFSSFDSYKKLLKISKQKSQHKLNDSFPASQIQYFTQPNQIKDFYSSVIINLKDGDTQEAEQIMRHFALIL